MNMHRQKWLTYSGNRKVTCFLLLWLVVVLSEDTFARADDAIAPVNPDQIHGELRSRHMTSLSSELPARIEEITLREGFRFEKGTVLIKLDCALIRAQHEKTKAAMAVAKTKYYVEKRLLERIS